MIKRVIALLKLKIKWKKRNQHNMTYLTNLCDIEQIRVGRYTYGPICVETFGCENTKLIIGQFCSVAQNVRFVLGGEHRLDCRGCHFVCEIVRWYNQTETMTNASGSTDRFPQ